MRRTEEDYLTTLKSRHCFVDAAEHPMVPLRTASLETRGALTVVK
jgi:hypothetical protein